MQYVFDEKAAEARDRLHESIVEMVLYLMNKTMDDRAIFHEISKQFGVNLDQSIITEAVDKLIARGVVARERKESKYYLVYSRKKEIEITIKERKTALKCLDDGFFRTYRKLVKTSSPEQEKIALEYFYQFCGALFSSNSSLVIGILRCSEKDIGLVKDYKPAATILKGTADMIPKEEVREAFHKAVVEILRDDRILRLLSTMARNYLYFRILNLDPVCKSLQKDFLSRNTLLLDTNFVIELVLTNAPAHKAALQCVSVCQKLGIELKFTKRTCQEFLTQLSQSNARFRQLAIKNLEVLEALDDEFIAEYATEHRKGKSIGWSDFVKGAGLLKNTLAQFRIGEYSNIEADFDVADIDSKGVIKDRVIACAMQVGNVKSETVAKHDSYHLLLIRKLREKAATGNTHETKYWFLTFDRSLLCADKAINEVLGRADELPSSIECWALMEMMLPFTSGDMESNMSHEAFCQLMKTEFRVLPTKLKARKLIEIQTPKIDYNNYSAEQLMAIAEDELVNKYKSEVLKVKFSRNKGFIEKAQARVEERVGQVAKSTEKQKPKANFIPQIMTGIIAILMATATIYTIVVQHYLEGGAILGILTIIFAAISLGYKSIELAYKQAKLRLQK